MTEKSSYFNEIASTLCAALTAFRDKRVEYYYRVDQKFDNGHQVSVDMEFFYPDEDATGAADRCTCTVKVTLDQVVPGIADLIADEMFRYVDTVACYHIQERPDDPRVVVIYLSERLDNRHWHEEAFLVDVADAITKYTSQQV